MNPPSENKSSEQWNLIGLGITIGVLILLSIFVDTNSLKEWVGKAGVWGPLVFILLKISTLVIAPLSGGPLYPTVGLLFGFWPGILYVIIGDIIGTSIDFYVARILGRKWVEKFISNKEEGILAQIINHVSDGKGFLHACMTCFALPELLSYGAGLSRLSYKKFILISPPFLVIPSIILVFLGSVLDAGNKSLLLGLLIPVMGATALLIGGTLFTRVLRKREDSNL